METREFSEEASAEANVVGVKVAPASECEGEWPPEVALAAPPRGERPPMDDEFFTQLSEVELQEALVAVALRVWLF